MKLPPSHRLYTLLPLWKECPFTLASLWAVSIKQALKRHKQDMSPGCCLAALLVTVAQAPGESVWQWERLDFCLLFACC